MDQRNIGLMGDSLAPAKGMEKNSNGKTGKVAEVTAYYNEFESYAAAWLKNLIDAGLIAPGDVDSRSITEVKADDLKGYAQCHFFAGIGGWSLAARLAGWDDDRSLWTGSCPCQPFSAAGKQKGKEDDRHLWPSWYSLIRECRPARIAGEQVASAIGHGWLDGVYSDLEGSGYSVGAFVLPACAVDAPHRRDRLWFVADAGIEGSHVSTFSGICRREESTGTRDEHSTGLCGGPLGNANAEREPQCERDVGEQRRRVVDSGEGGPCVNCGNAWDYCTCVLPGPFALADTSGGRFGGSEERESELPGRTEVIGAGALGDAESLGRPERRTEPAGQQGGSGAPGAGSACLMGDTLNPGLEGYTGHVIDRARRAQPDGSIAPTCRGNWDDHEWIIGHDGKARRIKPGIRLLVDGFPGRVGALKAGGNAIVPQVAAEVLSAWMECRP